MPPNSETKVNEALKLSEEQFRRGIEEAPIPTIMQTEDGQVLQLSRSWTELTGYKLSDMPTFDNWVTNAVYDGADAVRNHMRELFKGNKNLINVEFTVRTHNRGIRNWSFSASSPGTLLDGRRFIIGMAVDITERKKAEEALKESEERFAKAFFHGPQAMTIADMEGRIIEANEHYAKLFGFNHEELVGHTMPELVKIGNPHVRDKHLKQLEDKGSVEGEQFYVLPSGKTIYTFYSSQRVTIKGKPRLLTTIQDVTERRKAEGEVARLASFPTLNTNPIIEADFEGKITYLNPVAKGTLDNIEARGSSHPFLVDWQNVIQTFKAKPESILSREVSVFDHWYLQTLQLVPETECIRVYSVDITERKKAEQALAKSEEQFRRAIEEAPIPVIMHAEDGEVLQLSRTWTDLTGYTINDVPNFDTWLTKAVYGEGANAVRDHMHALFSGSKKSINVDFPIRAFDGSVRYWSFSASSPGVLRDGRRFIVGMAVDITERKEAEAALRKSEQAAIKFVVNLRKLKDRLEVKTAETEQYATQMETLATERAKQLQDAERLAAIGATAGMVGHDIRNPLQAITGEIYLLNDSLSELPDSNQKGEMKESMDSITANVSYINKIVADLQDYARPLKPEYKKLDLAELIDDTLRTIIMPSNIKLKVDTKQIPAINSDQTYLRRCITNLVNNAVQAMPEGGELEIKSYTNEDKIFVTVSDTGVGIPDHVKARLFTPMMTTKAKGQGLGLAVVKRLIEALNGCITFESAEGKGTKFIIELPLGGV